MADDIACQHAVFAHFIASEVACCTMQPNAEQGCSFGGVALCKQSRDNARQHVAATRCSHAWIADGETEDGSLRRTQVGGMAFEDDVNMVVDGIGGYVAQIAAARQPFSLLGMWRQDAFRRD